MIIPYGPAFLAAIIILARGQYSDHTFLFWLILATAFVSAQIWKVIRVRAHIKPEWVKEEEGKVVLRSLAPLAIEMACSTLVIVSVILSVAGIILSFF